MKPCIFFDRDGTLIEAVHYLRDPNDVRLAKGAGWAIRELRSRGYLCVVVTNQSAVGRGLLSESRLHRIHDTMRDLLARHEAYLDGVYFCPVVPRTSDRTVVEHPDRKPGPGMLLRASREMGIDLSRSWMVGDMISDCLAGRAARCAKTVLIGQTVDSSNHDQAVDYRVESLAECVRVISEHDGKTSIEKKGP